MQCMLEKCLLPNDLTHLPWTGRKQISGVMPTNLSLEISILFIDFNVILKGLGMVQEKQSILALSYTKEEYKTKLY